MSQEKYIGKSEVYKGVYVYSFGASLVYRAKAGKQQKSGFISERSAALFVDKALINQGKEPVNILKRK